MRAVMMQEEKAEMSEGLNRDTESLTKDGEV